MLSPLAAAVSAFFVAVAPSTVSAATTCEAGSYLKAGVCTACASGTWSAGGTATKCTAWSKACSATQFQSTPPSATADRVCTALKTCAAGTFVKTAATTTADRICEACAPNTFTNAANQASCKQWTALPCTATQFLATDRSATSDRVCKAFTACKATEYQTEAPTATSDRKCKALTICAAGTYVKKAGTVTSDRECEACEDGKFSKTTNAATCTAFSAAPCDTNKSYESVSRSAASDRVCTAIKVCSSKEFEEAAPTATSNRVCKPITVCKATEFQTVAPTTTSNRVCKALTVCTKAQYESKAATATTDRECTALTNCDAGSFVKTAATKTANRVCEACAAGTFTATANQTKCATPKSCKSTEYQTGAPTSTADRVCTALTACTSSQYQSKAPTATTNRECSALANCAAGSFVKTAATATTDRVCESCAEGTFTATANQSKCATPKSCKSTEYQTGAPSSTADRVCTALTACTSSQYQSKAPTATSNRECTALTACTSSQYQSKAPSATADRECKALTNCVAGQRVKTAPTATADRACQACGTGTFSAATNAATCTTHATVASCPAGQGYVEGTATNNRACVACDAGFDAKAGKNSCVQLADGTSSPLSVSMGTSTADLSWPTATPDGLIQGYRVAWTSGVEVPVCPESSSVAASDTTSVLTETSTQVTGLSEGTLYSFIVCAYGPTRHTGGLTFSGITSSSSCDDSVCSSECGTYGGSCNGTSSCTCNSGPTCNDTECSANCSNGGYCSGDSCNCYDPPSCDNSSCNSNCGTYGGSCNGSDCQCNSCVDSICASGCGFYGGSCDGSGNCQCTTPPPPTCMNNAVVLVNGSWVCSESTTPTRGMICVKLSGYSSYSYQLGDPRTSDWVSEYKGNYNRSYVFGEWDGDSCEPCYEYQSSVDGSTTSICVDCANMANNASMSSRYSGDGIGSSPTCCDRDNGQFFDAATGQCGGCEVFGSGYSFYSGSCIYCPSPGRFDSMSGSCTNCTGQYIFNNWDFNDYSCIDCGAEDNVNSDRSACMCSSTDYANGKRWNGATPYYGMGPPSYTCDCGSSSYEGSGVCKPKNPLNSYCGSEAECASGLTCSMYTCKLTRYSYCNPENGNDCEDGYPCSDLGASGFVCSN